MKEGYVKCIYKYGTSNCSKTYDRDLRKGKWINDILSEIAKMHDNVVFVDPAENLCSEYECYIVQGSRLYYSDHAHLTTLGAREVLKGLLD